MSLPSFAFSPYSFGPFGSFYFPPEPLLPVAPFSLYSVGYGPVHFQLIPDYCVSRLHIVGYGAGRLVLLSAERRERR